MRLKEGYDPNQNERDANGKWRYRPWIENGKLHFFDVGNVRYIIAGTISGIFYPSTAFKGEVGFLIHPVNESDKPIEVNQNFIAEITNEYKMRVSLRSEDK